MLSILFFKFFISLKSDIKEKNFFLFDNLLGGIDQNNNHSITSQIQDNMVSASLITEENENNPTSSVTCK